MIDREKRNRLSVMLRQLGSGSLSIDEFERHVENDELSKSEDRSLVHVLSFASSFYDDDFAPIFLTRFRGKNRLPRADRKRIATAVLFLKSDCEYQWPDDYDHPYLHDCVFLWLCAVAACTSLISFALSPISAILILVGIALALVAIWLFLYAKQYNSLMHDRWKSSELNAGRNYDVWPFVNDQELNEVLVNPWLLAGR